MNSSSMIVIILCGFISILLLRSTSFFIPLKILKKPIIKKLNEQWTATLLIILALSGIRPPWIEDPKIFLHFAFAALVTIILHFIFRNMLISMFFGVLASNMVIFLP